MAITWGHKIELFVAGRRCGSLEMRLPAELASSAEKFGLRFGCPGDLYGTTGIILDELRVSNVVRYQGDVIETPKVPFTADRQTLLLDHLDEEFRPDGENAETRAAVCSGKSGELGGIPSIGCRVVKGSFGRAMQIATGEARSPAEMVRHYGMNAFLFWWWAEDQALTTGWPPPLLREPLTPNLRQTIQQHNAVGPEPVPIWVIRPWAHPPRISNQFGHESGRQPLSTVPAEPPKGHYMWDACAQSGFADYMAAGTQ